jgi:hypothetical protein
MSPIYIGGRYRFSSTGDEDIPASLKRCVVIADAITSVVITLMKTFRTIELLCKGCSAKHIILHLYNILYYMVLLFKYL